MVGSALTLYENQYYLDLLLISDQAIELPV